MATEKQNKTKIFDGDFQCFCLPKNNKSKSEKKTKTKPRDFHGNVHHKAHEIERERLTLTRLFFRTRQGFFMNFKAWPPSTLCRV